MGGSGCGNTERNHEHVFALNSPRCWLPQWSRTAMGGPRPRVDSPATVKSPSLRDRWMRAAADESGAGEPSAASERPVRLHVPRGLRRCRLSALPRQTNGGDAPASGRKARTVTVSSPACSPSTSPHFRPRPMVVVWLNHAGLNRRQRDGAFSQLAVRPGRAAREAARSGHRLFVRLLPAFDPEVAEVVHRRLADAERFLCEVESSQRAEPCFQHTAQRLRPRVGVEPHRRSGVGDRDSTPDPLERRKRGAWLHEVERGADGDEVEAPKSGLQLLKVTGTGLYPVRVRDLPFTSGALRFPEHVRLGVDSDGLVEERCEREQELPGAAPEVEKPTVPAAAELPQPPNEFRRVLAAIARIERGPARKRPTTAVHHRRLPSTESPTVDLTRGGDAKELGRDDPDSPSLAPHRARADVRQYFGPALHIDCG
jgi:hypothetical protein